MGSSVSRTLNLLGFLCPVPVHETRRVLLEAPRGEVIEVICDDPETLHDIPALCDRMVVELMEVEEDPSGEFKFIIAKVNSDL